MPRSVSDRAPQGRDALRVAGSDSVERQRIRRSESRRECRRQSAVVAAADTIDRDLMDFLDAALEDMERRGAKWVAPSVTSREEGVL